MILNNCMKILSQFKEIKEAGDSEPSVGGNVSVDRWLSLCVAGELSRPQFPSQCLLSKIHLATFITCLQEVADLLLSAP